MSELYGLLNKLGLNNNEIETMVNINKNLKTVDPELVFKNLVAVSNAGFPDDELAWLSYNNPNFLTVEHKQLSAKLIKLKAKYDDIEQALKNNPELI